LHSLGFGEPDPDEGVALEFEHHIQELKDRLVSRGWGESQAEEEARRRFGDTTRYGPPIRRMERMRMTMQRAGAWWEVLRQGTRSIGRTTRRQPGFVAAVVLTLALGIGANATMYGIVDRLLLQPPRHIEAPEEVRRVMGRRPSVLRPEIVTQASFTYPDYLDWKAAGGIQVAAYSNPSEQTVGAGAEAERVRTALVSAEFFPLLGVEPRMGRFFTADEDRTGAPLRVVISQEYWERAYGASTDVLGRTVEIDGRDRTIIGVAPEGFTGVGLEPVDIWTNLTPTYLAEQFPRCLESRGCWWVYVVSRMSPNVAVEAAEAEATRLHLNGRQPMIDQGRYSDEAEVLLAPLIAAAGPEPSAESRVTRWLTGVSAIVLLIACANVANLLLARGTRRRRETSVRLAMGERRGRLVVLTLVETVGLGLIGGARALFLAVWGGDLVRSTLLPRVSFPDSAVNWRVVGFTLAVSTLAGLLAAVGPALQGSRLDVAKDLAGGGRGGSERRSRMRSLLTVSQAAMSVVLLVGAGLFVRSLDRLQSQDLGLDLDRVLQVEIEFTDLSTEATEQRRRYTRAIEVASALPRVEAAAATAIPLGWGRATDLAVPGLDSIPRMPGGGPYFYPVTPDYFRTTGLEVLRGRPIETIDRTDSDRVAVVSRTMAETVWPEEDALGQCLLIGPAAESCTTVVGVAEDAARGGYQDEPFMAYYLPIEQFETFTPQALFVRVGGDTGGAANGVQQALTSGLPGVRYVKVTPMRELLDPQARSWALGATMFSVFGVLALLLSAIGLYSVLAFEVAQRTRELGIRTALGANRTRLLKRVVQEGSKLALLGIALGSLTAWIAAPRVEDLLFQVSPHDGFVLGAVAAVLFVVGVLASLLPALRATRVDPMTALRSE